MKQTNKTKAESQIRDHTPWLSGAYSRDISMVQYLQEIKQSLKTAKETIKLQEENMVIILFDNDCWNTLLFFLDISGKGSKIKHKQMI